MRISQRPAMVFCVAGMARPELQAGALKVQQRSMNCHPDRYDMICTWWLIPLSKWVITPVISGLTLLIPFITGVITHLLSGMSHQVASEA